MRVRFIYPRSKPFVMNFEKLFKLNEELKELEKMDPRPHSYIREKLMEIANEAELLREAMLGPNGNA